MSKKILTFGASNSKQSINKKLAFYAARQIVDADVNLLDLNDFEMPIFSVDRQNESGIHLLAIEFSRHISNADGIIISFAEHNGAYTAAFKNIFEWLSRMEGKTWQNKPMFLLATSPGARGAKSVLDIAFTKFNLMNENTIVRFSLPSFKQSFSEENGIEDKKLKEEFDLQLKTFIDAINKKSR